MDDVNVPHSGRKNREQGYPRGGTLAAQHVGAARAGEFRFAAKLAQLGHKSKNMALGASKPVGCNDVEHTERVAPTRGGLRLLA
jgi:hypothetical protein